MRGPDGNVVGTTEERTQGTAIVGFVDHKPQGISNFELGIGGKRVTSIVEGADSEGAVTGDLDIFLPWIVD